MNIERIKELRDFIATLPEGACDMWSWLEVEVNNKTHEYFTFKEMEDGHFGCGTVGCIGGWTEAYFNKSTPKENDARIGADVILGIDRSEADLLFNTFPGYPQDEYKDVGWKGWKAWILERLDGVIADGEIRPWREQMNRDGKELPL